MNIFVFFGLFFLSWFILFVLRSLIYYVYCFLGMSLEIVTVICCMVMGGVLEEFFKFKVCFVYGGIFCSIVIVYL